VIPEPDDQKAHRKRIGSSGGRPVTYDLVLAAVLLWLTDLGDTSNSSERFPDAGPSEWLGVCGPTLSVTLGGRLETRLGRHPRLAAIAASDDDVKGVV